MRIGILRNLGLPGVGKSSTMMIPDPNEGSDTAGGDGCGCSRSGRGDSWNRSRLQEEKIPATVRSGGRRDDPEEVPTVRDQEFEMVQGETCVEGRELLSLMSLRAYHDVWAN